MQRRRDSAAVQQQDRLPSPLHHRSQLRQQRRRERIALLVAEVDDAQRRKRRRQPAAQIEPLQPLPALGTGRRAAVHGDRALERGALRRHRARVVARIRLLLVRRVVLLVHADQAEPFHRGEDGRARADDDARLAAGDPLALVAPLGVPERGMEDRDPVAEAGPEPADGLGREPDLGDEHDRAQAPLQRRLARLEIDLGLAAPGRAVQEEVGAEPLVHRADDAADRVLLRLAERRRAGLAAEGVALGGRDAPHAPSASAER